MRFQGGFGSAGAGNRTGRTTMTRGGLATTTKARRTRSQRVVTGTPSRRELKESIRLLRCWWCGADRGVEGRPFKSLSQHWRWAHGIDAQLVRDILGVAKKTSFIDEDLKGRLVAEGKRRYNPEVLHNKRGGPHNLSAFGLESQRRKIKIAQSVVADRLQTDSDFRSRFGAAVSKGQGGIAITTKACVICGGPFDVKTKDKDRYTTCTKKCSSERRRQNAIRFGLNASRWMDK